MKRKPARKPPLALPPDPADRAEWLEALPARERRKQEAAIRKQFPPGAQSTWPEWLRTAWFYGFMPDEYRRAHGEARRADRADRLLAEVERIGIELSPEAVGVAEEARAGRPDVDVPFASEPPWKLEMPEPGILSPSPGGSHPVEVVVPDSPPRMADMTDDEYSRLCEAWKTWTPEERFEFGTGFTVAEHLEQQQEAERIWSAGRLLDEIRTGGIEAAVEDIRFLEQVFARPMPGHAPTRDAIEHRKRPRPGPLFENVPADVLAALAHDPSRPTGKLRIRRARDKESLGPHLGRANDGPEYFAEARTLNVLGRRLRKEDSWESRAAIVFRLLLAAREQAHDRLGDRAAFPYRAAEGDTKNEPARMILRHMLFVLGFIDQDDTRDNEDFRSGDRFAAIEAAVAEAREQKVAGALRLTRSDMIEHAVLAGFAAARLLGPEDSELVEKALRLLADQTENGEILAAEGRAVKAENDKRRAALICKLYRSVRLGFPPGRRGNGPANRRVAERYEMQTGEPIHERTVRDTVKRAGLSDPPRGKRKD